MWRGVERSDQSGVEEEERRGQRVSGDINIVECQVAKRLRGEVI